MELLLVYVLCVCVCVCARRLCACVCVFLCVLGVVHCAYVIALLVRGYIALSLGNDWEDSRRSSDEANGLLPNNKLILYSEVSSSWLDVNYLLMHVNTCTHVYHYTHITYHTCTCIFTQHTYTYIHKAHSYTHSDDCSVKCDELKS